jgi:hypothetical protein
MLRIALTQFQNNSFLLVQKLLDLVKLITMMKQYIQTAVLLLSLATLAASFGVFHRMAVTPITQQHSTTTTAIFMAKEDEDLLRFARQSRSAQSDDNVVELMRPLGLVLNQDDNGNVYVETVAPRGNAARTGKVMEQSF